MARFGSGSRRLQLLWAAFLLRNGTPEMATASGMWVRHGLLQEMQNPHPLPGTGLKKHQHWVGNVLTLHPKTTGPPGSLHLALSLWESWGCCWRLLIALGAYWAPGGMESFGGDLWDVRKDLGLETSQLREELKPKSLCGFISSEPEASRRQPRPSWCQEKLWSISRCGERSYPLGVWGKNSCKPPRRFASP